MSEKDEGKPLEPMTNERHAELSLQVGDIVVKLCAMYGFHGVLITAAIPTNVEQPDDGRVTLNTKIATTIPSSPAIAALLRTVADQCDAEEAAFRVVGGSAINV